MIIDLEWLEENALFSCQNVHCAPEISYNVGMLAMFNGKPICNECYDEETVDGDPHWNDLPGFNPFIEFQRNVLKAAARVAEEAIVMLHINEPGTGPFTRQDKAVDEAREQIAAAIRTLGDSHD